MKHLWEIKEALDREMNFVYRLEDSVTNASHADDVEELREWLSDALEDLEDLSNIIERLKKAADKLDD